MNNVHNVQERLSALTILCIEGDKLTQTNCDEILNDFAMRKASKKTFSVLVYLMIVVYFLICLLTQINVKYKVRSKRVTCYMYSTSVRQSWSSYGHFLGVSHVTCTLPLLGSRGHLMDTSQECHMLHVLYLCQVVVVILWTLPRSVTCYMYFTSVRQS